MTNMGEIVNAFAKGKRIDEPRFEPITDVEKAKEMIGSDHLMKAHQKAVEIRDQKKQALDQNLSIVAQNLSERRQAPERILQQVVDRANRGEFGYSDRAEAKLAEIGENLSQAAGGPAFNKNDLDPTLLAYLEKHGHSAFFDQEASFSHDLLEFGKTQDELKHSLEYVEDKLLNDYALIQDDFIILLNAHEAGLDLSDVGAQALIDAHENGYIDINIDTLDELKDIADSHDHDGPVIE
jgi:hypothetical protein